MSRRNYYEDENLYIETPYKNGAIYGTGKNHYWSGIKVQNAI